MAHDTPSALDPDASAEAGGDVFARARTAIQETRGSGRLSDGRFGKGNRAAVTHAAYARQTREAVAALQEQRAQEIAASLGGADRLSPMKLRLVREMARVELFTETFGEALTSMGASATKQAIDGARDRYTSFLDRQMRLGQLLGLDPVTRRVATMGESLKAGTVRG